MSNDRVVLVLVTHMLVAAVIRDLGLSKPPADGGVGDGRGDAREVDRDLLPRPLPVVHLFLKRQVKGKKKNIYPSPSYTCSSKVGPNSTVMWPDWKYLPPELIAAHSYKPSSDLRSVEIIWKPYIASAPVYLLDVQH